MCKLLRIGDATDLDKRRAPESIFKIYEKFIPQISKNHWKKHFPISAVRFDENKIIFHSDMHSSLKTIKSDEYSYDLTTKKLTRLTNQFDYDEIYFKETLKGLLSLSLLFLTLYSGGIYQ